MRQNDLFSASWKSPQHTETQSSIRIAKEKKEFDLFYHLLSLTFNLFLL